MADPPGHLYPVPCTLYPVPVRPTRPATASLTHLHAHLPTYRPTDPPPTYLLRYIPVMADSPGRRGMRTSASAGSLPTGAAGGAAGGMADASASACGASPYVQKLPPVLRRSVTGNGPRQHTRAVFSGERERDGTPL